MNPGFTLAERFTIHDAAHDLLGRGGMGEVYRATDAQTGDVVAVKTLNPDALAHDPGLLERFAREGQALRQLNHPNIVRMVAAVKENGQHYLIMEFVEGGSLQDLLTIRGRLPPAQVIKIALEVADALTRAHHLGIIHRDLKPANVLLTQDGTPRLTDFGIASLPDSPALTQTGVLVGTVTYLSPEVCQGQPPDERSDIWAFGVMLFQLLTGQLPFQGANLTATLTAILTQPIPDLAQLNPDVPDALADLVYRMLEKDPQQRIPSVRLVGAELEALSKGWHITTPSHLISVASPRPPAKHNLPLQLTSFVGREREVEQVKQRLAQYRLVTLTGSGGIGKTRLSIRVAADLLADYPAGVWLVELAPLTDPAQVPLAVCAALDVSPQGNAPALDTLANYLRTKKLLLVVDNCEHVIEACAQLAEALLRACPEVRLLASSREALGIDGESAYRVPSLSLPEAQGGLPDIEKSEAVKLFVVRAQAVLSELELTPSNAPVVAQICRRLDGIALALELAASRVKLLSLEQIAARLDDAFRLLTGGSRAALPRQQTLRAMIDWSYNLLPPEERRLLRQLAVFAGGWTLEAAEAVCQSLEALDLLTRLVDKSLVAVDREHGAEPRYYLLETIRQYAREKLAENGEGEPTRRQHLAYFLQLAQRAEPHIYGAGQIEWLQTLEDEHENIVAALEWSLQGEVASGQQLAAAIWWAWNQSGHLAEGYDWLGKVLAATPNAETLTQANLLSGRGWLAGMLAYSDSAETYSAQSVALFRKLGDEAGVAWPLSSLALVAHGQADYPKAYRLLQESLALFQCAGNRWGMRNMLNALGSIAEAEGNLVQAEQLNQESLAISQEIGDRDGQGWAIWSLGHLAETKGEWSRAGELYASALQIAQEVKIKPMIEWVSLDLGRGAIRIGDYKRAEALLREALEISLKMGDQSSEATALRLLGQVAERRTDLPQARALLAQSLQLAQRIGDTPTVSYGLISIGRFLFAQGLAETGVRLLGMAEGISPGIVLNKYFPYANNAYTSWAENQRLLASARAALGDERYTAAWEAGRQTSLDEAVACALKELHELRE